MDIVPDDYLLEEIHTCLAERKQEWLEAETCFISLFFFDLHRHALQTSVTDTRACVSLWEAFEQKVVVSKSEASPRKERPAANPSLKKPNSKSQPTRPLFNESVVSAGRDFNSRRAGSERKETGNRWYWGRAGGKPTEGEKGERVEISLVTSFYLAWARMSLGYENESSRDRNRSFLLERGQRSPAAPCLMRDVERFQVFSAAEFVMSFDESYANEKLEIKEFKMANGTFPK